MSCRAGGKIGMLNFAWIAFEVSGDKKGSSPVFLCVHCVLRRSSSPDQVPQIGAIIKDEDGGN